MSTTTKRSSADTYLNLVRAFPLRRIRTRTEHRKALEIFTRLSARPASQGVRDYVDVLVDLIVEYEKRAGYAIDTSSVTAADLVRHRLEEIGMSVSALAREIGIPQSNLSAMLKGDRDWSKTAIRKISRRFNIRAERFL